MTSPELAPRVAIIGGGQLARMMAEAASALGIPLRLLAEAEGVSAAQVIPDQLVGDYRDLPTLRSVTEGCSVVTFDHEHVPTDHLVALEAAGVACHPGPAALVHAQDKLVMRAAMERLGAPQPRWAAVASAEEIEAFGLPCVLKVARGGYDGKGVWFVRTLDDAVEPLAQAGATGVGLLAEELVEFRRELSALVVRAPSGATAAYPVVASTQLDGICHEVIAPAPDLTAERQDEVQQLALRIAAELGVTGLLAVELMETAAGEVVVNELAMRPHNTGHWTQDGAVTSQFENHLRAVLDLPLGSTEARAPWTVMVNVLGSPDGGDLLPRLPDALAGNPQAKVHLYGKELRPGRKVGHVNVSGADLDACLEQARRAASVLRDGRMDA